MLPNYFQASWYRASHHCAQNGMELAKISSQFEYDQVKKQIGDSREWDSIPLLLCVPGVPDNFNCYILPVELTDDFWIGLTRLGNSKFYWFGYRSPVTFTASGTDINSSCSDCSCAAVNIDHEAWTVKACDALSYFICESHLLDWNQRNCRT